MAQIEHRLSKQEAGRVLGNFRVRAVQRAAATGAPDTAIAELLVAVADFGRRVGATPEQCGKAVKRAERAWRDVINARLRAAARAQRAAELECCDFCGACVARGELTREHLKPRKLLRRGRRLPADVNVVLTCQAMNAWLADRTVERKLGAAFHVALSAAERELCRNSPVAALRAVRARVGRDATCPQGRTAPRAVKQAAD